MEYKEFCRPQSKLAWPLTVAQIWKVTRGEGDGEVMAIEVYHRLSVLNLSSKEVTAD